MDHLALALSYVAILFFVSPWVIRRYIGTRVHPRTAALIYFFSIVLTGTITALFMGAMLFLIFADASLVTLHSTCKAVAMTDGHFLGLRMLNYPLSLFLGVFIIFQAGCLAGGGFKLLRMNHRIFLARKRASMSCPALKGITGNRWMSRVSLLLNTAGTVEAETVGILKPRIYISEGLVKMFSAQQLAAVINHEEAHCFGKDNFMRVIARTIATTLFYLPGLKTNLREMRSCMEKAADLNAATATGNPLRVADTLAKIACLAADPHGEPASALKAHKNELNNRLEALVFYRRRTNSCKFRIGLLVAAALITLMMFSGGAVASVSPDHRAALVCRYLHKHTPDGICLTRSGQASDSTGNVCHHFNDD
jgi:Zn-dependent protease with chaperone function